MKNSILLILLLLLCCLSIPYSAHSTKLPQSANQGWWQNVQKQIQQNEYSIQWSKKKQAYSSPNRKQNLRFTYHNNGFSVEPRTVNIPLFDVADMSISENEKKYKRLQNWELRLTFTGYGRDNVFFPFSSSNFSVDRNLASSENDDIIISYENNDKGMRQNFIVKKKPLGDETLQLRIHPRTKLAKQVSAHGILFTLADGSVAMRYNDLQVWDSDGKKLASYFTLHPSGDVLIEVDDSRAHYPITVDPLSNTADWSMESNHEKALFGYSSSMAGDVNNDGYDDIIIGAYNYDNGDAPKGKAYVYHGSSTGLPLTPAWVTQGGRFYGNSVSAAGDVNNDGFDDVIVGAYWADNDLERDGSAYVYFGSSTGLSSSPDWTAHGNNYRDQFGYSVSTAGDVNNDGFDDIIVGADRAGTDLYDEGEAYVFYGSATGPAAAPAWTRRGGPGQASFGCSVSTAGDVNGDGYADVIVGSHSIDNGHADEGKVYVFHGSSVGLSTTEAWAVEGNATQAHIGYSVSSAGDINNDGFDDVVIGGGSELGPGTTSGIAQVYYGSSTGLSTTAGWSVDGEEIGDCFGTSVSTAGDLNNDTFDDIIVGAYFQGQENKGKAYVYYGSVSGLSASPAWTMEGDQVDGFLGISVAGGGDINGDGYSDIIVGASHYDNGEENEGRVYVYLGSAAGVATVSDWNAESGQAEANMGISVFTAGDVNGDGFSDVIAGAYRYDNGQSNEGRAFVYHGSASGLSLTADWIAESDQPGSYFGHAASTAGDVNGDGYSDVIVAADNFDTAAQSTNPGRVFVYHGSESGLSSLPDWIADGEQFNEYFGSAVATAGDVNGDGFSDIVVGSYCYDDTGGNNEGKASVFHGSAAGLSTTADWAVVGEMEGALYSSSVSTAGDVNGDGFSDIIVGAQGHSNEEDNEGKSYLYLGSDSGLAVNAAWSTESNQVNANFGNSVSTAGDVNGDGYSDVIVGAFFYNNGETNEGRAFVYHGSANGLSVDADWMAESNQAGALFGAGVAPAGDVNGDGYADVIIGADGYSNGEEYEGMAALYLGSATGLMAQPLTRLEGEQAGAHFGREVAPAGDVNGDGYSDIIIGAYDYDNGEENEGGVFVFHGGSTGLSDNAVWTGESNQADAYLGYSVSTAGDVNGDGYSDVVVGAYKYDNGEIDEGRIFVFHGSADGVSATADWTAENNEAESRFGYSVSTAGDVNGDGYSDILTGAYYFANGEAYEGRAYAYYGSSAGLPPSPDWVVESNQVEGTLGYSVSTAGDVNGDGYSDVVVGAYAYNGGEGAAFVYHGSDLGLSSTPNWEANGPEQLDNYFGMSVSSAGDVNGDGYSDVIVGAPYLDINGTDEGKVFVYHGSSSGLGVDAEWTIDGEQDSAYLGRSVALAGDVNGDGYSDIITSAHLYDHDEVDEGRVYAFYGSENGLSMAADWISESDHQDARYGFSLSTAGDTNGDGYSDIIIGAYRFSDGFSGNGAAFIFQGSGAGLSGAADEKISIPQDWAYFGLSVSTAGDVNGDGYSDVIVGAPYFDNDENAEGSAFIYYGNGLPGLQNGLQQYEPDGFEVIGAGGRSGVAGEIRLSQFAKSPFGRTKGKMVYEFQENGTSFSLGSSLVNSVSSSGKQPVFSNLGTVGIALQANINGLDGSSHYRWRCRTEYEQASNPFQKYSPWRYYNSYNPKPFAGFMAFLDAYTLTYTASDNGSISGTAMQNLNSGMDGTTVEALPAAGYHFVHWSDGSSSNPRTDIDVSGSLNLIAYFSNMYGLNVHVNVSGTGIVSSNPEGINNCSDNCSADYLTNSPVSLTATADPGSVFTGWSGGCSGTGTCTVVMDQDLEVTAQFAKKFSWLLFLPAILHGVDE